MISDLEVIYFVLVFVFFFWRICGYLCNLLIVRLAVGFVGGLLWAWLCYKIFFFWLFFFCLKVEQILFIYLFKGVPKYRENIKKI